MSEQKIIFFDIDGTLEDQYCHIPESASSCIRKLKEKGHMVYVASGRPMWQIHDQIRELGFDGYVAECRGLCGSESRGKKGYSDES